MLSEKINACKNLVRLGRDFDAEKNLVTHLKNLVKEERTITFEILKSLQEIETRKTFAHLGYPSLFEFCTKELGYSEGAAHRRISAMRLVKDLPEIQEKIASGRLSLSVASQAQSFFRKKKSINKPVARLEKLNLLSTLENSSARNCEKTLLKLDPELATKDKERYLDADLLEIKITVDKEFVQNLEILKNQLAHKMPRATTKDILSLALRELVKRKTFTGLAPYSPPTSAAANALASAKAKSANYIPIATRRLVWKKSKGACAYIDPHTKRPCISKRFLEIDHIHPKSRGGSNQLENLQLLCDMHNRLKGARHGV